MKKRFSTLTVGVIAFLMLATGVAAGTGYVIWNGTDDYSSTLVNLDGIKEGISGLQTSLSTAESELEDTKATVTEKEAELKKAEEDFNAKENELTEKQAELDGVQKELDNALESGNTKDSKIKELKQKNAILTTEVARLDKELTEEKKNSAKLQAQLTTSQERVTELESEKTELYKQIESELTKLIDDANNGKQGLKHRYDSVEKNINRWTDLIGLDKKLDSHNGTDPEEELETSNDQLKQAEIDMRHVEEVSSQVLKSLNTDTQEEYPEEVVGE